MSYAAGRSQRLILTQLVGVLLFLVEIKYYEDTRSQNQLNAAKEQHEYLCNILQGASVTLHIILWVWAAPSTTPTL